jgi:superfamily I DNA/RNA helicase
MWTPTEEQRAIIACAQPPGSGNIVRVTAGAGTGKTTTLERLAAALVDKGHTHGMSR